MAHALLTYRLQMPELRLKDIYFIKTNNGYPEFFY